MPALHALRRQKRGLPGLDFADRIYYVAHGRRVRYRGNYDFRHVIVAAILDSFRDHPIRRSFNHGKLHAFLEISVAARFEVHRVIADILDAEHGWFLACRVGGVRRQWNRTLGSLGANWEGETSAEESSEEGQSASVRNGAYFRQPRHFAPT
jgi:hypothetical protein